MKFKYKKKEYEVALHVLIMDGEKVTAEEIASNKDIHGPMIDEALETYGEANFNNNGVIRHYVPSPYQANQDAAEGKALNDALARIATLEAENAALKEQLQSAPAEEEVEEEKADKKAKK